ncbi:hypothetical protein FNV43_RR03317 [Rhamnella rubrinervis]|uniref:Uncharacterized protein n=1 Tax=Rhamnella rubrinervis TaxID=2594499 RepID=A0A8K0MNZ3_9ROSA|nr:hypothetical protein FNV43_RR03317 [Rhamnella rubrinervis]
MARFVNSNNTVLFLTALIVASSIAVSVVLGQATETDTDYSVSAPSYDDLAIPPEDFKDEEDDSGLPPEPSPGLY